MFGRLGCLTSDHKASSAGYWMRKSAMGQKEGLTCSCSGLSSVSCLLYTVLSATENKMHVINKVVAQKQTLL